MFAQSAPKRFFGRGRIISQRASQRCYPPLHYGHSQNVHAPRLEQICPHMSSIVLGSRLWHASMAERE
jgi:hypothetical protein